MMDTSQSNRGTREHHLPYGSLRTCVYQTFFETNRYPNTSMGIPMPRKNKAATISNGLCVVALTAFEVKLPGITAASVGLVGD